MKRSYFSIWVAALFTISSTPLFGQNQLATGIQPFGSFTSTSFETINNGDLNNHFVIPVFSRAGRGIPFGLSLTYDSSIWSPVSSSGSSVWTANSNYGWNASGNLTLTGYITFDFIPQYSCGYPGTSIYAQAADFRYFDNAGVVHTFSPGDYIVYFSQTGGNCGPTGHSSSVTNLKASDGSGFVLSASITGLTANTVNASITTSTGQQITAPVVSSGNTINPSISDPNGNTISFAPGSPAVYTDTLGNALWVCSTSTQTKYIYVGTGQTAPTSCTSTDSTVTVNYTASAIQTSFGCSGVSEYAGSQYLVSSIVMPDSTSYVFSYETTGTGKTSGRLHQVTLPNGGQITWDYSGGGVACSSGAPSSMKRTSPDGAMTFSHSETGTAWTTTLSDAQSTPNQTTYSFQAVTSTDSGFTGYSVILPYPVETVWHTGASTLLETLDTCYSSANPCLSTPIQLPISTVNAITKLTNGVKSEVATTYDSFGNATLVTESDYGTASPGSILRQTVTSYQSLTSGGNNYELPLEVKVENGGGTVYSDTSYSYDGNGNLLQLTRATAGTNSINWQYQYNSNGTVKQSTDPNGQVTTYSVTNCNSSFPSTVTEPLSLSVTQSWNCTGGVQTGLTDENSQPWTTGFTDPLFWRPTSSADPIASTTIAYPTPAPNILETTLNFTSHNGTTAATQDSRVTLDSSGRVSVTQVKQSPSSSTYDTVYTSYDVNGRPLLTTIPYQGTAGQTGGVGNTTTYDGMGRVVNVANNGGGYVQYTYGTATSNFTVEQQIGPDSNPSNGDTTKTKLFFYDGLGRLTSVCEVTSSTGGTCGGGSSQVLSGAVTSYVYDPLNNITSVTQGVQTRSFSFDEMSRLTSETNPETGTVSYVYDADTTTCNSTSQGDLVRKTDALNNVMCYVYDALHRVTSITYKSGPYSSTPAKNFVYDASSVTINGTAIPISNSKKRLVEAYTGTSMLKVTDEAFSYDARGDLTDVYQWSTHSGGTYHLTNTYYPNGSVETLSSAGLAPALTYDVDGEGRITAVSASSGQNPLTAATYNNSSQATGVTYGSGDTDSFSFDSNMGIPTGYTINVGTKSQAATMTNNENGSLKTLAIVDGFYANENQTCQYLYDGDFRLFSSKCGTVWEALYGYDQYGNITKSAGTGTGTSFSPTYNTATNRYSSIPGGTVSYDGNGNLTNDTFHTYAWDADGNPTTISAQTFLYDAFDRRVDYGSGSSWTQYLYAPSSPGAIVGVGAAQTLGLRIQLPGGAQAITNSTAVTDYRRPNWQGSQPIDSSTTQTVLSDASYSPFGEHYQENGYSGYYAGNLSIWSSFMDGYAATWRLYHYDQGRWVSPDPAGLSAVDPTNPQSWNRYAYALNNPLSGVDPNGMSGNCEPPLVWVPNPGNDGGKCVAGNPSTTTYFWVTCAQAALIYPGLVDCGSGYSGNLQAMQQYAGTTPEQVKWSCISKAIQQYKQNENQVLAGLPRQYLDALGSPIKSSNLGPTVLATAGAAALAASRKALTAAVVGESLGVGIAAVAAWEIGATTAKTYQQIWTLGDIERQQEDTCTQAFDFASMADHSGVW